MTDNLSYSDIQKTVKALRAAGATSEPPSTVWVTTDLLLDAGWSQEDIDKLPDVSDEA